MDPAIVVIGVPTALGGHLPGMELAPSGLRAFGLVDRLRARPRLAGAAVRDAGDLSIDPGFCLDSDPRARNRAAICDFLPRERELVASALRHDVRRLAAAIPVVGFGATGVTLANGDAQATAEGIDALAEAALGQPST